MLSMRPQFALVLAVAGVLWLPGASRAQAPQVQEQVAAPAPPEPPAALAQIPPGQTVVTYQNGELTIRAWNAPLIDVLRAVCRETGAVLDDLPPGTDERIFATLGPGRARGVLASLLNGTRFSYVVVESADDPNALARLIVIPKTKDSNAEKQVTQRRLSSTRAASIGGKAPQQQQMERPIQAQAGAAGSAVAAGNSKAENGDIGDSDVAGMAVDPNMANLLRQIEAQIKAAAAGEATGATPRQIAPQAGAAAIDNSAVDLDANAPASSPGGRRRHGRR